MVKVTLDVAELNKWIGGDPFKEALLISEAPVAATTLRLIKLGRYVPGDKLARDMVSVLRRYPDGAHVVMQPQAVTA